MWVFILRHVCVFCACVCVIKLNGCSFVNVCVGLSIVHLSIAPLWYWNWASLCGCGFVFMCLIKTMQHSFVTLFGCINVHWYSTGLFFWNLMFGRVCVWVCGYVPYHSTLQFCNLVWVWALSVNLRLPPCKSEMKFVCVGVRLCVYDPYYTTLQFCNHVWCINVCVPPYMFVFTYTWYNIKPRLLVYASGCGLWVCVISYMYLSKHTRSHTEIIFCIRNNISY